VPWALECQTWWTMQVRNRSSAASKPFASLSSAWFVKREDDAFFRQTFEDIAGGQSFFDEAGLRRYARQHGLPVDYVPVFMDSLHKELGKVRGDDGGSPIRFVISQV
jgi:hypothetical protein